MKTLVNHARQSLKNSALVGRDPRNDRKNIVAVLRVRRDEGDARLHVHPVHHRRAHRHRLLLQRLRVRVRTAVDAKHNADQKCEFR